MSSYQDIINKAKKAWNCEDLMDPRATGAKIPFSSPQLNFITYGGVPRNAVTEFYGVPSGGKSTTAVDVCKNAHTLFVQEYEAELEKLRQDVSNGNKGAKLQIEELEERGPKKVLYVDLEHSFDMKWADTLGIVPGEVDIMQPPDVPGEDILQLVQELIESGDVGLVVLDSLPSIVTKAEVEKKFGERTVASSAGLWTTFFRKIVPKLPRYDTTLIFINQLRDNMDNPYVDNTPGGQAPKFYATLRIKFKIGSPVDFLGNQLPQSAENPAGHIITAKIVKQKSAPHDRINGQYYLMSQSGIRLDMDYCQLAVNKYEIIKKSGAWFTLCNPMTGEVMEDENGKIIKLNGMAKVLEYVQSNAEYYKSLQEFITKDIESNGLDIADSNEGETAYDTN